MATILYNSLPTRGETFHYLTELSILCGKFCLQLIVCARNCHPPRPCYKNTDVPTAPLLLDLFTYVYHNTGEYPVLATTLPVYKAPFALSKSGHYLLFSIQWRNHC